MIRVLGLRELYLGFLSVGFFFYGLGLTLGYHPTFLRALGAPVQTFGYMWIVVAITVSTGIWLRRNTWQFTIAVLMMGFWAGLLTTFWKGDYSWTASISWLILAANTILVGSWHSQPTAARNHEQ